MKNVFIVTGGTGGHVFPAIAVAEELRRRNINPIFITDKRSVHFMQNYDFDVKVLNIGRYYSGIKAKIKLLLSLVILIFYSFALCSKYKPSLIIGFGGYPTFPTLVAGVLFRIPIVIHEQNVLLGKTNRFFSYFAAKIAITFENTKNLPEFLIKSDKVILTGNPIRDSIRNILKQNIIPSDSKQDIFKIFIFAGSQGANFFSENLPQTLKLARDQTPHVKLNVVQQVQNTKIQEVKNFYQDCKIDAEVSDFFYNIQHQYNESDLIIARAGATTIAEIIYLKKPAILIPFPFSSDDHQKYNAKVLSDKNAAYYINQASFDKLEVAELISSFMKNREILQKISFALSPLKLEANRIFGEMINSMME